MRLLFLSLIPLAPVGVSVYHPTDPPPYSKVTMKASISVALALLLMIAGCALPPDIEKDSQSPYFSRVPQSKAKGFRGEPQLDESGKEYSPILVTNEEFKEGRIALAGFVVRDGVNIHRTEDLPPEDAPFGHAIQNGLFGWQFEWIYRDKIAEPGLVPYWNLDDYVPDDLMVRIWAEFSGTGILSSETLEEIRATGSGVRFIAMVSVVYDELTYNVMVSGMSAYRNSGLKGGAEGLTKVPGVGESIPGVTRKRKTGFLMTVYDLEEGQSVWSGGIHVYLHEDADRTTLDNYGGFQPRETEDGEMVLEEVEDPTGAPHLNEAIEIAMKDLISRMEKDVGGLPNPPSEPRKREPEVGEEEDMF